MCGIESMLNKSNKEQSTLGFVFGAVADKIKMDC